MILPGLTVTTPLSSAPTNKLGDSRLLDCKCGFIVIVQPKVEAVLKSMIEPRNEKIEGFKYSRSPSGFI
jgi:hypothetical protein